MLAVTAEVQGEPDPGQLRAWLLPDLIRRCAERRSLVPTICEITGLLSHGTPVDPAVAATVPDHAEARTELNIHPPARIARNVSRASSSSRRNSRASAGVSPSGSTVVTAEPL